MLNNSVSIKRLMRDWKEVQKNGKKINIFVCPLEDNLYEWHGNMVPLQGRYQGIIIHFIMKFKDTYPKEPPKVKLCTGIPHSNIIQHGNEDNFLCLDILNNFFWTTTNTSSDSYSGWSSAYSVSSLVMQIQTFLFDDYVENYDGHIKHTLYELAPEEGGGWRDRDTIKDSIERAFKDAREFKCQQCGHCNSRPTPEITCSIPEKLPIIVRKHPFFKNSNNNYTILPNLCKILFKYKTDFEQQIINSLINCLRGEIEEIKELDSFREEIEKIDFSNELVNFFKNLLNKPNYLSYTGEQSVI